MKTSYECYAAIQRNILGGKKIPHKTSFPLLRKEGETYYLAVYLYLYTKEDIETHQGKRPEIWALANLEDGQITNRFACKNHDFSGSSFEMRYDNRMDSNAVPDRDTVMEAFQLLDIVRKKLFEEHVLDQKTYEKYMKLVDQLTPVGYRQFCMELSKCM